MEKLYTSKTLLKMAGGRMHNSSLILLFGSAPGQINYKNHQKSLGLVYLSHLAPLILFFFIKRQSQKGGHCTMPP